MKQVKINLSAKINRQGLKSFLYKILNILRKLSKIIENAMVGKFVAEKAIRELAQNPSNLKKKLS